MSINYTLNETIKKNYAIHVPGASLEERGGGLPGAFEDQCGRNPIRPQRKGKGIFRKRRLFNVRRKNKTRATEKGALGCTRDTLWMC